MSGVSGILTESRFRFEIRTILRGSKAKSAYVLLVEVVLCGVCAF